MFFTACVVESNQSLIFRTMESERILESMKTLSSGVYRFDFEFHPIAGFVDYVCVAVECQWIFKSVIYLPAHNCYVIRR
jgi:hypothetical protein